MKIYLISIIYKGRGWGAPKMVIPFIPLSNKIHIHHLLSLYPQLTAYLHHYFIGFQKTEKKYTMNFLNNGKTLFSLTFF